MTIIPSSVQSEIAPGVIDLGLGHPASDLLPVALMAQAARHRFASRDSSFLQYGLEQGAPLFRRALAQMLSRHYRHQGSPLQVDPDGLLISNGISQALDLICTLFTCPGDTIVVEDPSYFLALRIFADHGLRVVTVATDDEGIDLAALAEVVEREHPRLLYTIPSYQNPSGVTLTAARRAQMVALAREHDFMIVADEVYHLLGFADDSLPPLAAWTDDRHVISLGSFSKILAPGVRLGWVQAHPDNLARIIGSGLLDSGGGLNPFTGAIVQSALEENLLDSWIEKLRATYAARSASLVRAVNVSMAESRVEGVQPLRVPEGGYFLWFKIPGVDTEALLPYAAAHKVGYRPGVRFSAASGCRDYLRLCFAYYGEAELAQGAQRLVKALTAFRNEH